MRVDENASNCNKLINYIYKNGSNYTYSLIDFDANYGEGGTAMNGSIVDMNGSSDYVEMYVYTLTNNGNAMTLEGGSDRPTIFGAYRIIT